MVVPVVRLQYAELVRTGASLSGPVLAVVQQRMELFDFLLAVVVLLLLPLFVVQLLFAVEVVALQDGHGAGAGECAVQRRAQAGGAGVMIRS